MELKDSLVDLPHQPLPSNGFLSGIFVTIWAVVVLVSAGYLYRRISRKKRATWAEFTGIFYGTCILLVYGIRPVLAVSRAGANQHKGW